MTWGVVTDVPAPVEIYDAVHARLLERTGGEADGLLVHLARATATGFQVIEVWESQEDFDRYQAELVGPVLAETGAREASPEEVPISTVFDVRGLVIPRARVAV